MHFPKRKSVVAAACCGLAGIAAVGLAVVHKSDDTPRVSSRTQPQEASPTDAKVTPPDYERELTQGGAAAVAALRSDSEIEDESTRPIQQVMQVDKGDTLLDLLLKAGVDRTEATKAIDALREVYNPRDLKAGQEITVTFSRPSDGIGTGPFHGLSLQPQADRQVSAKRQASQGFTAQEVKREVTKQLARYNGTIRQSLFESAQAAGIPAPKIVEMIRALSYDVDFQRDIQTGDSFEMMMERFYDKTGKPVRDGNILYVSVNLSGTPISLYRFEPSDGEADFYKASGESVKKALLRTPVDGARITSGFGMRHHPILGYSKMHRGVDFGVPSGTPIMAAGAGIVEMAGANGTYGYYVRIKHSSGYSTAYAHLSRFAQGIHAGKKVGQGEVIAYSGSTGRSTGPHLHYEVLSGGDQINPLSIKVPSGLKLAGKELDRFKQMIKQTEATYAQLPSTTKVASNSAKTRDD